MPVCRGEVERGVVAHVGGVDARAAADQHLHDLGVPALRGPVERAELVVVTVKKINGILL